MKTPRELLAMKVKNSMGNARYYRSLGDVEAVARHVAKARAWNRALRRCT